MRKPLFNMEIHTFSLFWVEFHSVNYTQKKIGRTECERIFDKCNFQDLKTSAIKEINKTKLTAKEYLKLKL